MTASHGMEPEAKFIPFSPIRPFVPRIPRRQQQPRPEALEPKPYSLGRGWTKESFVSLDAESVSTMHTRHAAAGSHFAGSHARPSRRIVGGPGRPSGGCAAAVGALGAGSRPRTGPRPRTPGSRPGPSLGGLDIAGLAHRPSTSPVPPQRAPSRSKKDRTAMRPQQKRLFLDLLSFTDSIGTTRHFKTGLPNGLAVPPTSFLKHGHMHRR